MSTHQRPAVPSTRWSIAAPALVCLLAAGAEERAGAQEPDLPGRRTVLAERLAEGEVVTLDGHLDEAAWRRAVAATAFVQQDPDNGAPATETTEVRLLFDRDHLYVGVWCFDSEPDRLLGNQMQRDQAFEGDDRFMWAIDTFLDGRTGYYFELNPSGAMGDGLVSPGTGGSLSGDVNRSWDGIWMARVRRTAEGWFAEVQIPFRTVNFDPGAEAWGINFQRTIRRRSEESLWTGHARNQGLTRMASAGRITGLRDMSQGLGLDVVPYVVGHVSAAPGQGRPATIGDGDVGVDLFYNVTPGLRLNFTVNTDFAETEVDERRVNLTRFPLFFPEKRDFFLEGSGYFSFSSEPGNAVVPFFSRRIGLDPNGLPQRVLYGAKLTGKAGLFDVGMLHVQTGDDTKRDLSGEAFTVVRARRRFLARSYVGAIYTGRAGEEHYDPAVGFVERRNYWRLNPVVMYSPRPRAHPFIRRMTFGINTDFTFDLDNRLVTRRDNLTALEMEFLSSDVVQFSVVPDYERLQEDFRIAPGVVLPAGTSYRFTRYAAEVETASRRKLAVGVRTEFGSFFSGDRRQLSVGAVLRPVPGWSIGLEGEQNEVDLAEGTFTTELVSAEVNTQFSPWTSLVNTLQYDSVSGVLGWQVRFRWISRPGDDFYFVYTHNWRDEGRFGTLNRQAAAKVVRTYRF